MRISFTGDLFLGETSKNGFDEIRNELDSRIIVNLESPFIPEDYSGEPEKDKRCLRHDSSKAEYIKDLGDIMAVNLSNNHISDYGNFGIEETKKALSEENLDFFGVGLQNDSTHNIYETEDVVFFSYTRREADQTELHLFNTEDLEGPKRFSLHHFKKHSENYPEKKKVVMLHWGYENHRYPSPQQRKIARLLVDNGADLIIGNHPHRIQGREKYQRKHIFYSLGNFFFPSDTQDKKHNKTSILPIFNISEKEIYLDRIIKTKQKDTELRITDSNYELKEYSQFTRQYPRFYRSFYYFYKFLFDFKGLLKRISGKPLRIIKSN